MNVHWMVLYKLQVFCSDIEPYEKNVSKRFFSETTWTIETKLLMNDHLKVLYKVSVSCRSEIQDGRHRRTQINIGPYGKMFKCLLLRNYKYDPLQSLGFLFRYEIQNGGYGRTQFNIGPYGKNVSKRFFSETTWTIETKLPRNNHVKVL